MVTELHAVNHARNLLLIVAEFPYTMDYCMSFFQGNEIAALNRDIMACPDKILL